MANWRGDLAGGVTSAILTLPVSMGYGILAFYPLGNAYVSYGVLAGLYGAILLPITAVLMGADTPMVYAPRSLVTFLLGSIVLHSLVRSGTAELGDIRATLTLVLFVVLLAGLFQALFGAFRLGSLVQYIPSPVMAGFQNAAAVLIFLSQLDSLLGFRGHVAPLEIPRHLDAVEPLTVAVGLVTAFAMWHAARVTAKIPPAILGLAAGSGAYYLIQALGGRPLGPVIGTMPAAAPGPGYIPDFAALMARPTFWTLFPLLATGALSLAIVASLDALLCAKTVQGVTRMKVRGNPELLRLGLGNMVAACFGGIAGGINLASSVANHRAGGRTPASVASLPAPQRAWLSKETAASSVIVLEALSRALPDSAYLAEIKLEGTTLRIIGNADDAPALLAPLEQTGHLSNVHFFAPTTRGPDGRQFRFHIEARVEPHIKIADEAVP